MIQGVSLVHPNGKIGKTCIGNFTLQDLASFEESEENLSVIAMLPATPTDYYDFSLDVFVGIGNQPSPDAVFDYDSKEWVSSIDLQKVKSDQWNKIKLERLLAETGGFEFLGKIFDSDEKSQSRIISMAALGVPLDWTLKDNSSIHLSAEDMQGLKSALANHLTTLHHKSQLARQLIENSQTKEEIEKISLASI